MLAGRRHFAIAPRGGENLSSQERERRLVPTLPWMLRGTSLGSWIGALPTLSRRGLVPLELAAMSLEDTIAFAKQLAFEMNIPYGGYLDEAVETWLRRAEEERELLQRVRGVYGTVLDWHLLQ